MKSPEQMPPESEQKKRARLISAFIETRVIDKNESLSKDEEKRLKDYYAKKSTEEKATELYQKMIVYMQAVGEKKKISGDTSNIPPVNKTLISRIKILYNDPAVRELIPATYGEARVEQKVFRLAGPASEWRGLEKDKKTKKRVLDELSRKLFQEEIKDKDDLEEAQHDLVLLREEISDEIMPAQTGIEKLSHYEHTAENTNAAALIEYEKLNEYNRQLLEEGYVWLPSREEIDTQAMKVVESGSPKQTRKGVFFISEPGSGKTEQIRAIAKRLTGMDRVKISSGPRIGDPQLIGKERVFPGAEKVEEGTFSDYRETVSGAWTGYDFSYQTEPVRSSSQIVELDEMPKAFENETFFTRMKGFFSLKDGDNMLGTDKPVLPGRIIFGSGNVGIHHGNKPVPPALEREFEVIPVDYPEMSTENPELYEFMLAALMQNGALPPVTERELGPKYARRDLAENERKILSDGSAVVAVDELIADPTNKEHGFLYRLAYAIKAMQNSYMARGGENPYIDYTKRDLLRLKTDDDGKDYISESGDTVILGTTITLNDINGWMRGYLEVSKKKSAPTMTEWMQSKLDEKINAKHEDKGKLRAIFEHFHLLDPIADKTITRPLTPKDIGYLSPRVPRPLYVEKPVVADASGIQTEKPPTEIKKHETRQVELKDGSGVLMAIRDLTLENGVFDLEKKRLASLAVVAGTRFRIGGELYIFAGVVEDEISPYNGHPVGRLANEENLYKIFTPEDVDAGILEELETSFEQDLEDLAEGVEDFCREEE